MSKEEKLEEKYERLRESRKFGLVQKLSSEHRACYMDGRTPADRAELIDGGFFEKFNSLDLEMDDEDKRSKFPTGSGDIENGQSAPNDSNLQEANATEHEVLSSAAVEMTLQQREALYGEVLYTVIHQMGAQDKNQRLSDGELFVYAQEVLKIPGARHRTLFAEAQAREPPRCLLKLTVVEARNLEPKDANGLSDPYCEFGLTSDDETGKGKGKSRTARDVLDKNACHMTAVKENTLHPSWNEEFTLDCDDASILSEKDNQVSKVRGFSGLGRYFRDAMESAKNSDARKSDDFLGFIEVPVKDVPSSGLDQWFQLRGRSSKSHVSGDCRLKIALSSAKKPELPHEIKKFYSEPFDIYAALSREFFLFDSQKQSDAPKKPGPMSAAAEFLLLQYGIQNDLDQLQRISTRWCVLSQLHWQVPMSYASLDALLLELGFLWEPKKMAKKQCNEIVKSLEEFSANCMSMVFKHRDLYPVTDSARITRLANLLGCISRIHRLEPFQAHIKEPLGVQLTRVLKEGAVIWYRDVWAWKEPQEQSGETILSRVVDVAEAVLADLMAGAQTYNKVFARVNVDYFASVYSQLELMLASDVNRTMTDVDRVLKKGSGTDVVGEKLFQLYVAIKEVIRYRRLAHAKEGTAYALDDYHRWFKESITRWFDIANAKAKERIRKSVEKDTILRIDASVMHSTSAVDTECCFYQIREFWKKIAWPEPASSYVFVMHITDQICAAARHYADLLFQKLLNNNYYDEDPSQFDVSEQLCVTLNDIEYIRLWLDKLPVSLGWQEVIDGMSAAHGERGRQHARTAMENMLSSADEDMFNKIARLINRIRDEMAVDIKKFVFQLCWASESIPADVAVEPLLKYLDDDLMVLNKSLAKSLFERILQCIWDIVTDSINNVLKTNAGKASWFYQRLDLAVQIIQGFFHADGHGLPTEHLNRGTYKILQEELSVRKMDTNELIQKYFADKCERQVNAEDKFGALTFKLFYDGTNQKLHVEVLNARNLPALDTNGLSDPYVSLRLYPTHIFGANKQRTEVVKNDLFPLFDATFDFDVPADLMSEEGACIAMTVLDYDVLSNDDIAGHVIYPLSDVMGVKDAVVGGFSSISQVSLNLFHPEPSGKFFAILESREDAESVDFVNEENAHYEKTISSFKE